MHLTHRGVLRGNPKRNAVLGAQHAVRRLLRLIEYFLGLRIIAQRGVCNANIDHGYQRVRVVRAQHAALYSRTWLRSCSAFALSPSFPYSAASEDIVLSVSGWSGLSMRR